MQRRKNVFGYVQLAAVVLFTCGLSSFGHGQVIHGSVYGTVTDNTGAAIPNATITVTDTSKGTSVQVTTNQDGEYLVPNLIPDVYGIKASAAGFGSVDEPGIQVSADTSQKVDLKLSVGSTTDTVTVTTEPPQLQTDRAEVGTVFNERTISGLPIAGRNFASLPIPDPGRPIDGMDTEQRRGRAGQPDCQHPGAELLRSWVSA